MGSCLLRSSPCEQPTPRVVGCSFPQSIQQRRSCLEQGLKASDVPGPEQFLRPNQLQRGHRGDVVGDAM